MSGNSQKWISNPDADGYWRLEANQKFDFRLHDNRQKAVTMLHASMPMKLADMHIDIAVLALLNFLLLLMVDISLSRRSRI